MGGIKTAQKGYIMDAYTIKKKIEEIDENGEPTCSATLGLFLVDPDNMEKEHQELGVAATLDAKIKFHTMFDKTMIDLNFRSDIDVDLKKMWNMLNEYLDILNEASEDIISQIPVLTLTFLPENMAAQIYCICTNPILWTLTAEDVGKPTSTLRFIFDEEQVNFYHSEDITVADIDADVEMDLNQRARAESIEAKRRQERLEYMQELEKNRKLYG